MKITRKIKDVNPVGAVIFVLLLAAVMLFVIPASSQASDPAVVPGTEEHVVGEKEFVRVVTLDDGTQCAVAVRAQKTGGGVGIDCDWNQK